MQVDYKSYHVIVEFRMILTSHSLQSICITPRKWIIPCNCHKMMYWAWFSISYVPQYVTTRVGRLFSYVFDDTVHDIISQTMENTIRLYFTVGCLQRPRRWMEQMPKDIYISITGVVCWEYMHEGFSRARFSWQVVIMQIIFTFSCMKTAVLCPQGFD